MASRRFVLEEIERVSAKGERESLSFEPGVNVLVGRPNTGKTMWLTMLDYVLGCSDPVQKALSEDVASKYDSIRVTGRIGDDAIVMKRGWKQVGSKGKVVIDDSAIGVENFSSVFLEKLRIPVLHYPQGNPYSPRTWPELSWRTLYRHLYRQQLYCWGSLVERQPAGDQLACILHFLGLAENIYCEQYGSLIQAQKSKVALEAERDNFVRTLNDVARELVDIQDENAGITPEVISASTARLDAELEQISTRRDTLLEALLEDVAGVDAGRMHGIAEERARLLAEQVKVAFELKVSDVRIEDIKGYMTEIKEELTRLDRARVSGKMFSGLRVTNCPACDQPVSGSNDGTHDCFLCHLPLPDVEHEDSAGVRRIAVAISQLASDRNEADTLLQDLTSRQSMLTSGMRRLSERVDEIEQELDRVRRPAAAVLPPEIAALDTQAGRIAERKKQLERIRVSLRRREQLASEIADIGVRVKELDEEVERQNHRVDFETAADLMSDGMNEFLSRLNVVRPNAWTQGEIGLRLAEKSFRFTVGGEPWESRLGATLTLYFLLAYQYALLRLTKSEGCHYPGFAVLDMPAELPDVESVSDLENFVLLPFIELLAEEDMADAQVIVAGGSFAGLEGTHRVELSHVYR